MTLSVDLDHAVGDFHLQARFDAPQGVTVLFGRSGAGKSTVIRAVAGLLTPRSGRIAIGDRVLFDAARGVNLPPHRRRLGYVFQDGRLFPHMSVERNLLYGQRFAPAGARKGELSRMLNIPRRSTLVVLKGEQELGRLVAQTGKAEIKALMDTALGAATS